VARKTWKNANISALALAVLLALTLACDAWADIKGMVVNESGEAISGAKIVVTQGNTEVGEHITDPTGKIDVHDGICPMLGCSIEISVTVSKEGYKTVVKHFDANKDANAMRKGDLLIVLGSE